MSTFQVGLLTLFGFLILAGVLTFAGYGPTAPGTVPAADLTIWGTVSEDALVGYVQDLNAANAEGSRVTYRAFGEAEFEDELLQALATGRGPDLIILPASTFVRESDKLYPLSYEQYSARSYLETFVDGASLFAGQRGIYALPLAADPMVMYWNKDLLAAANIAKPPQYWDEVLAMAPKLSVKDAKGNLTQSAVALGGYRNIANAKDILASLFFQVGEPIAAAYEKESGIGSQATLGKSEAGSAPTESALRFYAQFGNPSDASYSWNRGLANSRELFISGELAIYFGHASEFAELRRQNPNLSFDVALMPTIRPAANTPRNKNVAGELYGIAVLAATKNPAQAFQMASILSSAEWNARLTQALGLPSLRRDLLGENPKDPYATIFNQAALSVRAWPDPSPVESDAAFRDMVESVLTGVSPSSALLTAHAHLQEIAR